MSDVELGGKGSAGSAEQSLSGINRRSFIGRIAGGVAASAVAATLLDSGSASAQPVSPVNSTKVEVPAGLAHRRLIEAFDLRVREATQDALVPAARNVNNGDEVLYPDKAGAYSKALPHDSFGRVDLNAFASLKKALKTGEFSDFEDIVMGGTRPLNGPQAGLCFALDALDGAQFGQSIVPPAPRTASPQNATELLEHYWASLLRDVSFADYDSSELAADAATELGAQQTYLGPRNSGGQVTPNLLFRGSFPGESLGPYISQFFLIPTMLGAQPISQQTVSYLPNIDYMTNWADWLTVQNGGAIGLEVQKDSQLRCQHSGRSLAAFTHVDVLYQAYFTAYLVLSTLGASPNPGNPYIGSKTETGFGTFGGPDFATTLAAVGSKALNAVWYQKWFVHLRPRPEATGGIVHLIKSGQSDKTDARLSKVILDSRGLQQSFNKYGTWLLSQAFPEGSPAHPSYPTGHGVVAGACITVLKFFFDGNFVIPNPVLPAGNGLSLEPYTGPDAGELTVNGELNKLGHNVSFGHGIHAGIHWRSDTDTSLLLGEAVALSYLEDKSQTYNEPFTVHLTKFDRTLVTISNG